MRISNILRGTGLLVALIAAPVLAMDAGTATGTIEYDGESYSLTNAYTYTDDEGRQVLLLTTKPIPAREIGDSIWEPHVQLTLPLASDGDIELWSTYLYAGGLNASGMDVDFSMDASSLVGEARMPEPGDFFDKAYSFDAKFAAIQVDPNATFGEPLPDDGGEPGDHFRAWIAAVHGGELEKIKELMPPEMKERAAGVSDAELLEGLQMFVPKDIRVTGGSGDGQTAILQVAGTDEGIAFTGEATMEKQGDHWINTDTSLKME